MPCFVHIAIRASELDAAALEERVRVPGAGGIVAFRGIIRPVEEGQEIGEMAYEHYPGMAERELSRLADQAAARWPVLAIAIEHRVGPVPVGHDAVVVAVSTPHRAEAFAACAWLMDAIKQTVPIWKRSALGPGRSEADPATKARLLRGEGPA